MAGLLKRSRRTGLALAIAVALTVLSAVALPLLGDNLAHVVPGVGVVLADESEGHGG